MPKYYISNFKNFHSLQCSNFKCLNIYSPVLPLVPILGKYLIDITYIFQTNFVLFHRMCFYQSYWLPTIIQIL